ncbi:MAG: HD domain-containing protein [Candidatus Saganbacteria bacterium]|nr:HD domain-containing protein [Candidatus Saganbacteria bacterium]
MQVPPTEGSSGEIMPWAPEALRQTMARVIWRMGTRYRPFVSLDTPLLEELSSKIHGTFRHSVIVAHVAAGVAFKLMRQGSKINADLVRIIGLYHDVGKMLNPEVFAEAHLGTRRHLPPLTREQLKIQLRHPQESVAMLRCRFADPVFPEEALTAIAQHHGNAKRFYREGGIIVEEFKYEGDPPSTKESAVIMLVDSCEAFFDNNFHLYVDRHTAIAGEESLHIPDLAEIQKGVDRIVDELTMVDERQISPAVLNATELVLIKKEIAWGLYKFYNNLELSGNSNRRKPQPERRHVNFGHEPDRRSHCFTDRRIKPDRRKD